MRFCALPASPHAEDDDFGQAGTLYREVLSETDHEHMWASPDTSGRVWTPQITERVPQY